MFEYANKLDRQFYEDERCLYHPIPFAYKEEERCRLTFYHMFYEHFDYCFRNTH